MTPLDVSRQARVALVALRMLPALTMVVHGVYRISAGLVMPFGEFLTSQHVPLGLVVAWVISVAEVGGGLTLAAGRLVVPLSLWFAIELTAGIVLVHLPEGWFVVGGGRNGMEYSVVLVSIHVINALLAPMVRALRSPSPDPPVG